LTNLTAHELATIIRQHNATAQEVLETHLDQIARHNPSLNAIVTLDEERARQRAKEADGTLARGEFWGPLHGVPVTIKDVFETDRLRTTSSFRPLANNIPKQDATVVGRLRKAGAIIMGKTNTPESESYRAITGNRRGRWSEDALHFGNQCVHWPLQSDGQPGCHSPTR
jgi:amidase